MIEVQWRTGTARSRLFVTAAETGLRRSRNGVTLFVVVVVVRPSFPILSLIYTMPRFQILHIFILAFVLQARAHLISFLSSRKATAVQSFQDQSWLWGWAWGPDSTVSIVDRSPPVTFPSRPAGFGSELSDPLLGYVIPLNSFTFPCPNETATSHNNSLNLGCPSLCVIDPNIPERLEPWIALVQRGACQFVSKAREAQRLGAKAIVVGGEDPSISGKPDTLVNMFSPGASFQPFSHSALSHMFRIEDASDVTIAATYIKYSSYLELYSLIAASNTSQAGLKTVSLLISSEFSAWQWYSYVIGPRARLTLSSLQPRVSTGPYLLSSQFYLSLHLSRSLPL